MKKIAFYHIICLCCTMFDGFGNKHYLQISSKLEISSIELRSIYNEEDIQLLKVDAVNFNDFVDFKNDTDIYDIRLTFKNSNLGKRQQLIIVNLDSIKMDIQSFESVEYGHITNQKLNEFRVHLDNYSFEIYKLENSAYNDSQKKKRINNLKNPIIEFIKSSNFVLSSFLFQEFMRIETNSKFGLNQQKISNLYSLLCSFDENDSYHSIRKKNLSMFKNSQRNARL